MQVFCLEEALTGVKPNAITLVFLPGLTADHRLFDKAKWLNEILEKQKDKDK